MKYDKKSIRNYWDKYYSENSKLLPNSDFSKFVSPFLIKNLSLVDVGCGDGRDSLYFSKKKIYTTGIDFSEAVIKKNKKLEDTFLKFFTLDLAKISSINEKFDYAYCRFLFHAINESLEDEIILWFKLNIKKQIFIETRVKDLNFQNIKETHYRRYFDKNNLIKKIKNAGLNITYQESSTNFSKYRDIYKVKDLKHDPLLLRIIISK